MGYSTKRSNRHFLRAMLSRSISSVNHTTVRHESSIPALCSLATGRWARGLHRNTNRDGAIFGWGVAACSWLAFRFSAEVTVELKEDGTARAICATQDIGTGTYTVMSAFT
jgi:CO/xanthine dehydrogenase Mo-binding subunit